MQINNSLEGWLGPADLENVSFKVTEKMCEAGVMASWVSALVGQPRGPEFKSAEAGWKAACDGLHAYNLSSAKREWLEMGGSRARCANFRSPGDEANSDGVGHWVSSSGPITHAQVWYPVHTHNHMRNHLSPFSLCSPSPPPTHRC